MLPPSALRAFMRPLATMTWRLSGLRPHSASETDVGWYGPHIANDMRLGDLIKRIGLVNTQ